MQVSTRYANPDFEVKKTGNSIYVALTEPIRLLGWKVGDKVKVSIPDDHIVIERMPKAK